MRVRIEFGKRRETKVTCDYCREEKGVLCVTRNWKFCKKCLGYDRGLRAVARYG